MSIPAHRKRPIEEVNQFDEINQAVPNATIHAAAITSLSPVKEGKRSKYFDGTLTDGISHMRMIGFNTDQQRKLTTYFQNTKSIRLVNCEIKPSREGESMEIMLKKFTEIKSSPKDISIPKENPQKSKTITIQNLEQTANYQRVCITAKVIDVADPSMVGEGKVKQEVTIADSSGTTYITSIM
jgi:hypothetical protein